MRRFSTVALALLLFFVASSSDAANRYRGVVVTSDITESDTSDLAPWKANVVRYPLVQVQERADDANEETYNQWVDEALVKLDAKLPAFQSGGMRVLIVLSTVPGGFKSYSSPRQHRLFSDEWAQKALVNVWKKIASHYAGNDTILGFDIVNEPSQRTVASGLKNWSGLAADVARGIREVNASHLIFVEALYGNLTLLSKIKPIRLKGIVYSFHYYYTNAFKMQGFDGRPINVKYPYRNFNKRAVLVSLAKAIRYQQKNKVQIYVGEFSAVRWAPSGSAYKYLKDLIAIFEQNKWNWTYHGFREADCWSVEHSTNAKDHTKTIRPTDREMLLRKYFAKNRN